MKKERKVWAITLIAFWWLAPNQTNAQQNSDSVRTLKEVVVTATKFPKNQSETGKVLAVIDEVQIHRNIGKDISQLLSEQVGLIINGANSNPGKDKSVFLRGAASQYTLILLDGIPVNDPSGVGGAFDLRLLPIEQVERIEILKGSHSTLYGSDAIAGVINIITKKRDDQSISGYSALSYGSFKTIKGNVGIAGGINILDYNINYARFKTDGISEANDQNGNGNFDKDGYDQNSFQFNLGIKPIQQLSIRPFVRFTDYDGEYDGGAFVDDKTAGYTSKFLNYGLNGQYILPKGTINLQIGRSNTKRNFQSALGIYPYRGIFDNVEIFANHDVGKNLQILAGINHQILKMDDENAVIKNPSLNITGVYSSFFINNFSGFFVELGGRFHIHSQFGNVFTYSINPSYLINNQVKFFANYSTGFKAPTLSELYGQFGANNQLKPQESNSAEAGFQYIPLHGKVDLRAAYFDRRIKNGIIYSANGYVNLDQQNDYGFEIEPAIKVNEKLSITMFYAFVDGKVTTITNANRDTTFNNLIRRPKDSFGFNIGYTLKNFFISLNFKSFSKRSDLFFSFDPITFESKTENVKLEAYGLLDAYVEYRMINGKVRLFLDAKNLLDQKYTESYGYNTLRFNMITGVSLKI